MSPHLALQILIVALLVVAIYALVACTVRMLFSKREGLSEAIKDFVYSGYVVSRLCERSNGVVSGWVTGNRTAVVKPYEGLKAGHRMKAYDSYGEEHLRVVSVVDRLRPVDGDQDLAVVTLSKAWPEAVARRPLSDLPPFTPHPTEVESACLEARAHGKRRIKREAAAARSMSDGVIAFSDLKSHPVLRERLNNLVVFREV